MFIKLLSSSSVATWWVLHENNQWTNSELVHYFMNTFWVENTAKGAFWGGKAAECTLCTQLKTMLSSVYSHASLYFCVKDQACFDFSFEHRQCCESFSNWTGIFNNKVSVHGVLCGSEKQRVFNNLICVTSELSPLETTVHCHILISTSLLTGSPEQSDLLIVIGQLLT